MVPPSVPASRRCLALAASMWLAVCPLASATPPATTTATPAGTWVQHEVLPGERLADIAERYGVETQSIVRWNGLDSTRPIIRVGHSLKILALDPPPPRVKLSYRIRPGDTWSRIARHHQVNVDHLRKRWNPKMGAVLRAGERLTIWIEGSRDEAAEADEATPAGGSQSVGKPDRGRIQGLDRLPERPELYVVRNPQHSYGSAHAIALVQQAIAAFRASSGFRAELVMGDMSQRRGGRFRPHRSHQSGRDIDIRLPLRAEVPAGTVPTRVDQVDWDMTWKLVRAMLDTNQVVYIFLSRNRQKPLYEAAKRAGLTPTELDEVMQYPRHAQTGIVRHSRGHTKHIHVRFTCGPAESRCRD